VVEWEGSREEVRGREQKGSERAAGSAAAGRPERWGRECSEKEPVAGWRLVGMKECRAPTFALRKLITLLLSILRVSYDRLLEDNHHVIIDSESLHDRPPKETISLGGKEGDHCPGGLGSCITIYFRLYFIYFL
jgi:hypothetical protein